MAAALAFVPAIAHGDPPRVELPGVAVPLALPLEPDGDGLLTSAPPPKRARKPRWLRMSLELAAVTAVSATWYWSQTNLQRQDWELQWDWDSWRFKLTELDSIRFDTNEFTYNAINHPIAGAMFHQVGRANGMELPGAILGNVLATMFWEYVVEFKEIVSLNDLIINTSAGLAVGEPLWRVGMLMRAHPSGAATTSLAAASAPVDFVHGVFGDPAPHRAQPWHEYEIAGGGRSAWVGDVQPRLEAYGELELSMIDLPEFATSAQRRGRVPLGAWSRIRGMLSYGENESARLRVAAAFASRTSLWGRYWIDTDATTSGLRGSAGIASIGTGFTYETRRLDHEKDRMATAHLVGGELALVAYRGPLTLTWTAGTYADFAMIQALAFGPEPVLETTPPFSSVLAAQGYYYGIGATGETRLSIQRGPLRVRASLRGHAVRSIDAGDRHDTDNHTELHGVTDQRLFGKLHVGVATGPSSLHYGLVVETAHRRGAAKIGSRTRHDVSLAFEIAFSP